MVNSRSVFDNRWMVYCNRMVYCWSVLHYRCRNGSRLGNWNRNRGGSWNRNWSGNRSRNRFDHRSRGDNRLMNSHRCVHNNRFMNHYWRMRRSLVGDISHKTVVVISMVLDVLGPAVRQLDGVGALHVPRAVGCLPGVKASLGVVVVHAVLVAVRLGNLLVDGGVVRHRSVLVYIHRSRAAGGD